MITPLPIFKHTPLSLHVSDFIEAKHSIAMSRRLSAKRRICGKYRIDPFLLLSHLPAYPWPTALRCVNTRPWNALSDGGARLPSRNNGSYPQTSRIGQPVHCQPAIISLCSIHSATCVITAFPAAEMGRPRVSYRCVWHQALKNRSRRPGYFCLGSLNTFCPGLARAYELIW